MNANYLRFNETEVLEALRQQDDIDNEIGWDLSAAIIWRPFVTQNVVFRLSGATLVPGDGFKQLYATDDDFFYSGLGEPRADLLGAAVMFRLSHITVLAAAAGARARRLRGRRRRDAARDRLRA